MADNTTTNPGAGGDVIATDDLTTLNGGGVAGVKAQRVKVGHGADGVFTDTSDSTPMPVKLAAGQTHVVTAPAITKGTQGANGFATQDLKDSGRAIVNAATAIPGVTCVTVEALVAMDVSRDGAATASGTSIVATTGKKLRLQGMMVALRATAAALISGRIYLRINPVGAVTVASPIIVQAILSVDSAAVEAADQLWIPFPDGIEISGNMQVGVSQLCSGTGGQVYASLVGYEY